MPDKEQVYRALKAVKDDPVIEMWAEENRKWKEVAADFKKLTALVRETFQELQAENARLKEEVAYYEQREEDEYGPFSQDIPADKETVARNVREATRETDRP